MRKSKAYTIMSLHGEKSFEDIVNMVNEGWELLGAPFSHSTGSYMGGSMENSMCQALIKYEEELIEEAK